jgi:hypothetical protein
MFKSSAYDETVPEEESNLMDAQESMLSVAIAISDKFLEEAKARGLAMSTQEQTKQRMADHGYNVKAFLWRGECGSCRKPFEEDEERVQGSLGVEYHKECNDFIEQRVKDNKEEDEEYNETSGVVPYGEDDEEEDEDIDITIGFPTRCALCEKEIQPMEPFTVANRSQYHAECYNVQVRPIA